MKIISWNVNGLSGLLKQDKEGKKNKKETTLNPLETLVQQHSPDFLCLQEIKTSKPIDIKTFVPSIEKYRIYWNCAQTK
jgi:exonuclease III